MALGKVICTADPAEAGARDAMMIAAVARGQQTTPPPSPAIGSGALRTGDPQAGALFPQGRVRTADGRTGLFDDVVGRGWVLVGLDGDPAAHLDPATLGWFQAMGGITVDVGRNRPLCDLEGAYARWFGSAGVAVALQRPDFYLFGAATTSSGSGGLLEALREALTDS